MSQASRSCKALVLERGIDGMGATRERRVPVQERSKKRLEAILEAAARLFAGSGYEQTTMEGIAEAAGTSIGSVYQFFPNKLSSRRSPTPASSGAATPSTRSSRG